MRFLIGLLILLVLLQEKQQKRFAGLKEKGRTLVICQIWPHQLGCFFTHNSTLDQQQIFALKNRAKWPQTRRRERLSVSKNNNRLIKKEPNAGKNNISVEKLLVKIQATLDDYKADNIVTVSLKGKSDIADYMVIASGRSSRQIASIAEGLGQTVKKNGVRGCIPEGQRQGDWVLLDAGDIIVHLFRPEVREFYNLEKMWGPDMVTSPGPMDF